MNAGGLRSSSERGGDGSSVTFAKPSSRASTLGMSAPSVAFPTRVVALAEAADTIAALPGPLVHVKGFAKRLLLKDAAAPSFPLNMRGQAALPRERAAAEENAARLVSAVVAAKPDTLVWDGDA